MTIAVALSGGVDSATAALLLKEKGKDLFAVTMHLFDDERGQPPVFLQEAAQVARHLGLAHHIIDLREAFTKEVIHYFDKTYLAGRTPNPCVVCNARIKYGLLFEKVSALGATHLATGHYARILPGPDGEPRLYRARAERKDQSYVLSALSRDQMARTLLPLGDMDSKEKVRKKAREITQKTAQKKDSFGICFLTEDHKTYLIEKYPDQVIPGDFVDPEGTILGRHQGITHYTIGQKRGLGLHLPQPKTVVALDPGKNQVILSSEEDAYARGFTASDLIWHDGPPTRQSLLVKICQWGYWLRGTVDFEGPRTVTLTFDQRARAVTPGQRAVFYSQEGQVLGSATIDASFK